MENGRIMLTDAEWTWLERFVNPYATSPTGEEITAQPITYNPAVAAAVDDTVYELHGWYGIDIWKCISTDRIASLGV